ncbi:MAG: serine hydrolase [Bacteroidetes bacterium]|nr:serine hydrolase [Bacteroidota bacterium]
MKNKLNTLCLVIIIGFGISGNSNAQSFNQQLATLLQDSLNHYFTAINNIKGMSAAVYVPGQGTWQGVAGVSHAGQPITNNMKFGLASISKLYLSTIMLKLAEKNIVNLNDPIQSWIPSYSNINPNITIRQLLNHTSGVADPFFISPWFDTIKNNPTRVFTPHEVLGWVGAPYFAPGTGWSYSNTNYVIAGMIIQNATGIHLSKLIRDSILTPLNLTNTFYDVSEPEIPVIAHRWWNGVDYHDTSRVGLNTAVGYAGAMFSTPKEVDLFYNALFSGQLLNANSLAELTNFVATTSPFYQYGLGISKETTQGYTYWGHGGDTWGYKNKVIYDNCSGIAVCGLSNAYPSGISAVVFILYRVVKNAIPGCNGVLTGPASVCKGQQQVTYMVTPITNATSYVWSLPGGFAGTSATNTITVNISSTAVSGNVTVRGSNQYGEGASAQLSVTVNNLPNATITAAGPIAFCKGQNVTLNAISVANQTYQWKKANNIIAAATNSSYVANSGGTYKVTVTNSITGCSRTTPNGIQVTVNGLPSASITPQGPTTFCPGGSVNLLANSGSGYAYQWQKGLNTIQSATAQNYVANATGNYRVIVTNAAGCSKSSVAVAVSATCKMMEETTENISPKIYPIPATDKIVLNVTSHAAFSIYDIYGKLVYSGISLPGNGVVDISRLEGGTYFILIHTDKGYQQGKFVKL